MLVVSSCDFKNILHVRIMGYLKSSVPESVVNQVIQLSTLVTLSSRIGHHCNQATTTSGRWQYDKDLQQLKLLLDQKFKEAEVSCKDVMEGGSKGGVVEGRREEYQYQGVRWETIEDVSSWVECPLGLCPGQVVSADMFDFEFLSSIKDDGDSDDGGVRCDLETSQQCKNS